MSQFKSELLINSYLDWYKNKITYRQLENAEQIITPYLNHLNDRISLFVEILDNEKIKLSDDGVTLNELELMALKINTDTRTKIINDTLFNYGVKLEDGILYVIATNVADFPQKKHNLIQTILSLYDLLFTNTNNVKSLFKEDVLDFFFENDFGGSVGPKFNGQSGIDYYIDYSLGATKKRPNTLFKFKNNLDFQSVAEQAYIADDLQEEPTLRMNGFKYVIVYGDKRPSQKAIQAANHSNIQLISFNLQREKLLSLK